jgi:DNA-binding IclR family transcriptional regulator
MPEVGIVIPAHACALGKALLAHDPAATAAVTLRSMTGGTVTDRAALDAELAEVRRTGLAVEVEEAVLGEYGLAAPLADAVGDVVGALGLVVPASGWPLAPAALDALRAAARAVSRELGAPTWPPVSWPPSATA